MRLLKNSLQGDVDKMVHAEKVRFVKLKFNVK